MWVHNVNIYSNDDCNRGQTQNDGSRAQQNGPVLVAPVALAHHITFFTPHYFYLQVFLRNQHNYTFG